MAFSRLLPFFGLDNNSEVGDWYSDVVPLLFLNGTDLEHALGRVNMREKQDFIFYLFKKSLHQGSNYSSTSFQAEYRYAGLSSSFPTAWS